MSALWNLGFGVRRRRSDNKSMSEIYCLLSGECAMGNNESRKRTEARSGLILNEGSGWLCRKGNV